MPPEAQVLPQLRASLLGPVQLAVSTRALSVDVWPRRSARTLLLLLLTHPRHSLPRDQVIDLLWPDAPLELGSASLRKAVHSLRRVLEPSLAHGRASDYVEVAGAVVRLREGATGELDTAAFEQALRNASGTRI